MSARVVRALAAALALLAVGGCASSSLEITVDLFDSDPRVREIMTPRDARQLVTDLETLLLAGEAASATRTELASAGHRIFADNWRRLEGEAEKLEQARASLEKYTGAVAARRDVFREKVGDARARLQAYVETYRAKYERLQAAQESTRQATFENCRENHESWLVACDPPEVPLDDRAVRVQLADALWKDEIDVHVAVSEAVSAYGALDSLDVPAGGEAAGTADLHYRADWTALEYLLNARIEKARLDGDREAAALYRELGMRVAQSIRELTARARGRVSAEPARALRNVGRPDALAASAAAAGNELETLRNDLPESATSRAALSSLVRASSRFFELIDRLQDAGDPVWRVIADPDNAKHWNEVFSHAYFYAEGKSSVVVVRDSPVRFRVLEASNDPTVVVQSQLEIARSVSNAALSIAGAVSGLPTGALASSAKGRETDDALPVAAGDGLAARRARTQARERERAVALSSLQSYLRNIESNLAALASQESKAVAAQRRRLETVLRGHRPIFALPAEGGE